MYAACKKLTSESVSAYRLKVRRWRKVFHEYENQKKTEVVILTSNKIYLEIKTVTRDKERN